LAAFNKGRRQADCRAAFIYDGGAKTPISGAGAHFCSFGIPRKNTLRLAPQGHFRWADIEAFAGPFRGLSASLSFMAPPALSVCGLADRREFCGFLNLLSGEASPC
jgi:hypothetical protein